jgi:hypothetical protein
LDSVDYQDNVVDSLLHPKHQHIEHNHHNDLYCLHNDQMHIEIFPLDKYENLKQHFGFY